MMFRQVSKKRTEPFDYQIVYETNADYQSLADDVEHSRLNEYIEYWRVGGKGGSLLEFELRGYPGLYFQLSPRSTLNIFIKWDELERLFEPLLIVRDKILKPKKGYDRVIFSYRDCMPIGGKATYKYLKEIKKSIEKYYEERRSASGTVYRDDVVEELNEIKNLLNDESGICVFLKYDLLELGCELEKEGLIKYHL